MPNKKYVVRKQTTKQIITCRAQQKKCSPKTDYQTNNHLPCPTKNYVVRKTDYETNNHLPCPTKKYVDRKQTTKKIVVRKQTTKQIIICRAQQKNM